MTITNDLLRDPLLLAFVALGGTILGSFLNVCIHRLPRGESVVSPPSRCGSCETPIRWYDNIPIVSYLLLRGRCRVCGASFSPRYLIVELTTGLLAVGAWLQNGPTLRGACLFVFACALLVVTYIDLDHRIIPNRITLPGIVVGLVLAFVAPRSGAGLTIEALDSLEDALLGMLVGGGILWTVAWTYERLTGREGMGGGDIKLLAMIGTFLGWQSVLLSLLLASFLGSVIGIALMVARGQDTKLAIPFGPFLALGALVALFFGPSLVSWYMNVSGLSAI